MFPWLWLRRWALPYLLCLTASWKQRDEGELGFIFIPQPGILTEDCCLAPFTFCALRRYNLKFPFLPLYPSHFVFYFSEVAQNTSRRSLFSGAVQLRHSVPGSEAALGPLWCLCPRQARSPTAGSTEAQRDFYCPKQHPPALSLARVRSCDAPGGVSPALQS